MVYAQTVAAVIDSEINHKWSDRDELLPVYSGVDIFENFIWYGLDCFQRTDNAFILKINRESTISGIMGINYKFFPGENTCTITIDDVPFSVLEVRFDYDSSQRHIIIANPDIDTMATVTDNITISFENAEQADGFNGICFSRPE